MPDVTRSDSQRSDASHKPRVSFNRDVHVKRIGREGVVSALAGDGEGHLVPLAVRRERPGRLSRRELEKEAEAILRQAERVQCTPTPTIVLGVDKYSTLPSRPKHPGHPAASSIFNSLDRRTKKKPSQGSDSTKLKRRFSNPDNSWRTPQQYSSSPERSFPEAPQKRRLSRSVSDAGRPEEKKDKERSSIFGTLDRIRNKKKKKPPVLPPREDMVPPVRKKKQLSPIIEMSPKVEADPFKFAPTESTVVYAEVVARPSGKTTVHTTVPVDTPTKPEPESDEDEGVDMGHRGGTQSRRFSYDNNIPRSTSPKEYSVDVKRELEFSPKRKNDDIREDKIINMLRSRSNPLLDEELVGGYRREVRTERVIRVEANDEPDGRGRADGMDFSSRRRSSKDFFEEEIPLKNNYYGDVGKIHSYDDLDRIKYQEPIRAWTPPLETSLIDSNNLSYRRDRLESRLTNHKRRFLSAAHENKSYRDDKIKNDDLRKDFLTSQLSKEDKERGYFEKKIATEIEHRQHMLKNKDIFADSGIEMSDYRKDSAKDVATLNRKNAAETTRIIRSETSRTKSTPTLNKSDYQSDGERRYKGDVSMTFINEERRSRDVVPASSTLVKSYTKPTKEGQKTTAKKDEKIIKEKKKDKLTRMDKVKQLMFGSKEGKKNKKKKQEEDEEDLLRKRYTEYKGSDVSVNSSPVIQRRRQTSSSELDDRTDQEQEYYGSRQRLATPSPRPAEDNTWFKSLSRRNKHSKPEKKHRPVNGEEADSLHSQANKHLRFFGDSDRESLKSARVASPSSHHRNSSLNTHLLQVPPHHQGRRHITVDSSAESTTEGDSSQQSQKSVVYLHAATVGDIPGSRKLHKSVLGGGRRSMSREELSSHHSDVITPQTRTLSRSISVLAPWRPRHNRQEVVYDGGGKPPKAPKLRQPQQHDQKEKIVQKSKKTSSKELRKSKENLIDYKGDSRRNSSESILSDQKRSRGNLVFVGRRENHDEVDNSRRQENGSVIDRSHHTIDRSRHKDKTKVRDLSRSISIPKDSRVSSGWFKGTSKAK